MDIYIFVNEALIDEVYVDGQSTSDYRVVDFDALENGRCPLCGSEVTWEGQRLVEKKTVVLPKTITTEVYDEALGYSYQRSEPARDDQGNLVYETKEIDHHTGGYNWCGVCKINWDKPPDYKELIKKDNEDEDWELNPIDL